MAFVLVQHLAPDHESILVELIHRHTRMQVREVTQGMAVQPNCVYVIPPGRNMALLNATLQLLETSGPRSQHLSIDFFFRSLAEDQHECAICIVLSGTGSDGTMGARAVKGAGGMAMVQDPASTEYDGMPRSLINTGLADYVLRPAEMPAQLINYVAHSFGKLSRPIPAPAADGEAPLATIFRLIQSQTGHDFSQYKLNTIDRCVHRRMAVHQIQELDEYSRYLEQCPADVEALFHDLLIGVTSFFRDAEAFEALEKQVVPRLFAGKAAGSLIRVWAPGCSSGEEAFSIAILLQERSEALKQSFKLQVFATDIDRAVIERARAGLYPASIAADISPERLARFFVKEPDGTSFRISKSIRDLVIFSEQDLIKDPPFSKLDLISCRNLLIYMGGELQKKLMPLFHYALNQGGMLFLGSSETVGDFGDLFATEDRKFKLYVRKEVAYTVHHREFIPPHLGERSGSMPLGKTPPKGSTPSVREMTERAMLQQFAPAGALVNDRGDILYLHGRTGRFLEPSQGEAAMNILKMAREGLRPALTTTLHQAVANKEPAHVADVRVKSNGDLTTVDLTVQPVAAVPGAAVGPKLFLVVFDGVPARETEQRKESAVADTAEGGADDATDVEKRIAMLEKELRISEEYIQFVNEDQQSTNEALKSSNEEMQSMNEELQAANEELETSREELQSVNEELATVNAELQTKLTDLSRSNSDMMNLLAGTGIGTIFVDQQMRIRQFTPAVTNAINLIPTDVGRPVGHIVSNLVAYDQLVADLQEVLNTLTPKEVAVQTQAGQWYLMRMRPYRTVENAVDGAVITFTDITEIMKARAERRDSEALRRLAVVVRDASDAITVEDFEGRILAGIRPRKGYTVGTRPRR